MTSASPGRLSHFADLAQHYSDMVASPPYVRAFGEEIATAQLSVYDEPCDDALPDAREAQLCVEQITAHVFDLFAATRLESFAARIAWGVVNSFHRVASQVEAQEEAVAQKLGELARSYDPSEIYQVEIEETQRVCQSLSASRPLNEGQLQAAIKILSSPDRIIAVQGIAGAGKSTMFASVGAALEEARVGVRGTAFANKMVNDLKNGSAIDSQTVASFLLENEHFIDGQRGEAFEAKKDQYAGTTLLLDEASLVSNVQMEGLTVAANIFGFEKLAIVGDKAQLSAIEAGKPQVLLEANGIDTAYMNTNLRQRTPLMIKVAALANAGKAKAAIAALGSNVIESEERAKAAAELWLSLSKEERAQTAIFTSGKMTRDAINEKVQIELLNAGEIGAEVTRVCVYERVDRTREELRYANSYSSGMILDVAVGSRRLGLTKGEYHVRSVSEKGIVHLVRDGRTYRFDPQSVPAREKDYGLGLNVMKGIKLSAGDKIRWTGKDKARGITNASLGTVTSVEDGNITVETPETSLERLRVRDKTLSSKQTFIQTPQGGTLRQLATLPQAAQLLRMRHSSQRKRGL